VKELQFELFFVVAANYSNFDNSK